MNTPNTITLIRLLMIPLIVFFYLADFIPYGRLVATILFIIACLTDFLDGYLARKQNKVTTLGKFFDAIADKVLIMTGLILIVAVPIPASSAVVYPSWLGVVCAIIILAREFIVSALRQYAAAKGLVLAADMGGKIKATAQYIVVSLYMALSFVITDLMKDITIKVPTAIAIIRFILMLLLIGTAILTIYSGASYIIKNRAVFCDKDGKFTSDFKADVADFNNEDENLEEAAKVEHDENQDERG